MQLLDYLQAKLLTTCSRQTKATTTVAFPMWVIVVSHLLKLGKQTTAVDNRIAALASLAMQVNTADMVAINLALAVVHLSVVLGKPILTLGKVIMQVKLLLVTVGFQHQPNRMEAFGKAEHRMRRNLPKTVMLVAVMDGLLAEKVSFSGKTQKFNVL